MSANPFLTEALHASFPSRRTAATAARTARPALTSSREDAEALLIGDKASSMAKNNATSAVGAKLLFGALQVVSLMQLMSDGEFNYFVNPAFDFIILFDHK